MLKRLFILLSFIPTISIAQMNDNFEDGDISDWEQSIAARWAASDISPITGSYSLHHIFDNPDAGRDQISFQLPVLDLIADTVTWKFKVIHGYNPSSSNNWSVFLTSDANAAEMYPSGSANGYAIGVNYTGSTDTLKFWKISSGGATEIFKTTVNWQLDVGTSKVPAIEIIRAPNGKWEVSADIDGDFNNLALIGFGTDDTYLFSDYFGVYYEYSSSQDQQLWIDDIEVIGEIYTDNDIPVVDTIEVISSSQLNIEFNESLDSAIAVNKINYTIDRGIGNPDSISVVNNKKTVELFLAQDFDNKEYYNLTIENIRDEAGNILIDTTINLLYFEPEAFDIIINEIMADPSPAVNLPEYEFIEIINVSGFNINLSGWKLKTGSTTKDFPNYTIDSAAYAILCSSTAVDALDNYGDVVEFSSLSITNSGTSIVIINEKGNVIDSINFTDEWYQDSEKDEGGWAIERIDPLNTCSTLSNWKASINSDGGTPGIENSIFASNIDIEEPQLTNIEIISNKELILYFNEQVVESVLEELSNFSVDNGIGNPINASPRSNYTEVELEFPQNFPQEIELLLSVENMEDECGNVNSQIIFDFIYYEAKPFDVVFNEIMANPEPVLGLPEFEYIEIYNITDYEIKIKDWALTYGSTVKVITSGTIAPRGYLIFCGEDAVSALQSYGEVIGFSTFSLTDGGQTIILRSASGEIISTVVYSDSWYKDEYKAEGGWALEQIDPENPCGGFNNWIASEHESGGTPGQLNSVDEINPDVNPPELEKIVVIDSSTIQLFFNESIDSISAFQLNLYSVNQGIGNPNSVILKQPDYSSLVLSFDSNFEPSTLYILEINGGVTDCSGNEIYNKNIAQFSIPELPLENDLVINEILFNPLPGGYDFVEIYNRSEKTIDMQNVVIASYSDEKLEYVAIETISNEGFLIFPKDYIVLTENVEAVQSQYMTTNPDVFIEVNDLPGYNDDKGRVVILDKWQNEIDNLGYNDDMQFDLLATTEGVSLERINFDRETNDKTNWHSASELVGFATPGYENSQFMELTEIEDVVSIEPEIFSPDNDGFEDFANISFTLDDPGYVANIKIYDSKGRLVRYLANNKLLGADGVITWDGLDEENQKAPVGIYVVFIEIFNLEGSIKQYKKSVVLAAKW